jgi:hypothetical protein
MHSITRNSRTPYLANLPRRLRISRYGRWISHGWKSTTSMSLLAWLFLARGGRWPMAGVVPGPIASHFSAGVVAAIF